MTNRGRRAKDKKAAGKHRKDRRSAEAQAAAKRVRSGESKSFADHLRAIRGWF